jgi:fructose-1-phosphate kinase PfkB-like protein
MVAGLAYAITREKDGCLATLLCMANAAGAAGAATAGTQLLDKKDFDTFCTQTKAITI